MMRAMKVGVRCRWGEAFSLEVFPEMRCQELREFVVSCALLHGEQGKEGGAVGLVSCEGSLLLDYLLASPNATLAEVQQVYKYSCAQQELALPFLKQADFERHRYYDKPMPLPIAVHYTPTAKNAHRTVFRAEEAEARVSREADRLWFSSEVRVDEGGRLVEWRWIAKAALGRFEQVEAVVELKARLAELRSQQLLMFGELLEAREEQDCLGFLFDFLPAVSIPQVLRFDLSPASHSALLAKIWMFLLNLAHNGYESLLCRLLRQRALPQLLDALALTAGNRLVLTDLCLALERHGPLRLSPSDHQTMADELNIYLKLNKAQLQRHEQRIELEHSARSFSTLVFAKIFLTRSYSRLQLPREHYQPRTTLFLWHPDPRTPHNERSQHPNDATTTKKPKPNKHRRTRKEESVSRCGGESAQRTREQRSRPREQQRSKPRRPHK